MKKLPNKVNAGDSIKAKDFNDMVDYLRSITLREGTGYRVNTSAGGTSLNVRPSVGGGGSVAPVVKPRPLEVTLSRPAYANEIDTELQELQALAWVHLGYIGGVKPDNIYSELVLVRSGDTEGSLVTNYIYAEVDLGQQVVLSVTGVSLVASQEQLELTTEWNDSLQRPQMIRLLLGTVISREGGLVVVGDVGDFNVFEVTNTENADGGFVTQVLSVRI